MDFFIYLILWVWSLIHPLTLVILYLQDHQVQKCIVYEVKIFLGGSKINFFHFLLAKLFLGAHLILQLFVCLRSLTLKKKLLKVVFRESNDYLTNLKIMVLLYYRFLCQLNRCYCQLSKQDYHFHARNMLSLWVSYFPFYGVYFHKKKKGRKFQISNLFSCSSVATKLHTIDVFIVEDGSEITDKWLVVITVGSE